MNKPKTLSEVTNCEYYERLSGKPADALVYARRWFKDQFCIDQVTFNFIFEESDCRVYEAYADAGSVDYLYIILKTDISLTPDAFFAGVLFCRKSDPNEAYQYVSVNDKTENSGYIRKITASGERSFHANFERISDGVIICWLSVMGELVIIKSKLDSFELFKK